MSSSSSSSGSFPPVVAVKARPTPSTDQCASTCGTISVTGKAWALAPPFDDSSGDASVAFGDGHWYVAWGGRPAIATQVQRFTSDGEIDGVGKKITGTTPLALGWLANAHQLELRGWIPPAYTGAGYMESYHRFDAALAPVGDPTLLRTPGDLRTVQAWDLSSGSLVTTTVLNRTEPLAREIVLDPAAGVNQTPVQKQWFIDKSASEFLAVEHIGGRRLAVVYDGTNLVVIPLADDGTKGEPKVILNGPLEQTNVSVQSVQIGSSWWIGAWSNAYGQTTLHFVSVDPTTLAPASTPFAIAWPSGTPFQLVNANGSLAVLGSIEPDQKPTLPALVPIDTSKGAACRPNELLLADQRSAYQGIRAIHFEGATAGAVFETWGSATGSEQEYFARLSCAP
jgi:hypothetical protein